MAELACIQSGSPSGATLCPLRTFSRKALSPQSTAVQYRLRWPAALTSQRTVFPFLESRIREISSRTLQQRDLFGGLPLDTDKAAGARRPLTAGGHGRQSASPRKHKWPRLQRHIQIRLRTELWRRHWGEINSRNYGRSARNIRASLTGHIYSRKGKATGSRSLA